jgi:hypothetical protein
MLACNLRTDMNDILIAQSEDVDSVHHMSPASAGVDGAMMPLYMLVAHKMIDNSCFSQTCAFNR